VSGEILLQALQALNNKDDRILYLDLHDERPYCQQTAANTTSPATMSSKISNAFSASSSPEAWSNVGAVVNGWFVKMKLGNYGTYYLLRSAATNFACYGNIAQEALYPGSFTDIEGTPLNGTNNYVIHFNPGQTPPVGTFCS
jgi:hypothetical protein